MNRRGAELKNISVEAVIAIAEAAAAADAECRERNAKLGFGPVLTWQDLARMPLARGPAEKQLRSLLIELSREELLELQALMWVGRGDYTAEEFPKAMAYIARTFSLSENDAKSAVEYIAEKAPLHEYLWDGVCKMQMLH